MSTEVKRGRPRKVTTAISEQVKEKDFGFTTNDFLAYVAAVTDFLGKRFEVEGFTDSAFGDKDLKAVRFDIEISRGFNTRMCTSISALRSAAIQVGLLKNIDDKFAFSESFILIYSRIANIMHVNCIAPDVLSSHVQMHGPSLNTYNCSDEKYTRKVRFVFDGKLRN